MAENTDDRKISQMTTAPDVADNTLVEVSVVDQNASSGYSSYKATLSAIFDKILNAVAWTQRLITPVKTIFGSINYVAKDPNMADEFSTSSTYAVGDYCIHDTVLYKCTTAITTAGAWDSSKWTSCVITDELGSGGSSTLDGLTDVNISSPANGETVVYNETSDLWENGIPNIAKKVNSLPVIGEYGVLYLVPKEGSIPDAYDEYMWMGIPSETSPVVTPDSAPSSYDYTIGFGSSSMLRFDYFDDPYRIVKFTPSQDCDLEIYTDYYSPTPNSKDPFVSIYDPDLEGWIDYDDGAENGNVKFTHHCEAGKNYYFKCTDLLLDDDEHDISSFTLYAMWIPHASCSGASSISLSADNLLVSSTGENYTLTAKVVDDPLSVGFAFTYKWYYNGSEISGATSNSITVDSLDGVYVCTVKDQNNSTRSATFKIISVPIGYESFNSPLPSVTANDDGKILGVSSGIWSKVTPQKYHEETYTMIAGSTSVSTLASVPVNARVDVYTDPPINYTSIYQEVGGYIDVVFEAQQTATTVVIRWWE